MPFFQHMKSTDPAVVDAVRARQDHINDWHRQANDWGVALGGVGVAISTVWGVMRIGGVISAEAPSEGRWRKPHPRPEGAPKGTMVYSPLSGSDVAREMDALGSGTLPVPGLAVTFDSPSTPDGSMYVMNPRLVVADGVAYMGLTSAPAREQSQVAPGGNWVECLSSEFETAIESRKAEMAPALVA